MRVKNKGEFHLDEININYAFGRLPKKNYSFGLKKKKWKENLYSGRLWVIGQNIFFYPLRFIFR